MSEDPSPATTNGSELTKAEDLFTRPAKRRFDTLNEPTPVSRMWFRIRSLTAGEMARYQRAPLDRNGKLVPSMLENAEARLLVLCVVDKDGNPLMSKADVPKIQEKWDSADTHWLYNEIAEHCGVGADELDALRKNLQETLAE